jgi:two-component system cell cycle response regulator DivK
MDTSNKVVLVVEDNAANMRLCSELLEAQGYVVLQATHGIEGLQVARDERPNVILMDMQLPDISGLDVTKRLKEDEDLKSIPVIAVTASAMKGDEEKYLQGGCDAYISKPISIPDFLQTVAFFLDESRPQALASG